MTLLRRLANLRALPWGLGLALFALVMLWTLLVTPRYRSEALLEVQKSRASGAGLADAISAVPGASLLGINRDEVETQIGVLRSRRVIDAVLDSLALTVRVKAPRIPRDSLVLATARPLGTQPQEAEGVITFRRAEGGRWTLSGSDLSPGLRLPASLGPADTLRLGDMVVTLAPTLEALDLERFGLEVRPRYLVRRAIYDRLEVRRQSAGAQLISVTFDDADAPLAAAVIDGMLREFLAYAARTARSDAGLTAEELRRQVSAQQQRLRGAEEALQRYQEQAGIIVPDEQLAAEVKRYAVLRGTLDQLEVERNALARLLAVVDGRASGRADSTEAYRQLATFPSLITNRAIQDLLLALTTLENDRSALRLVRSDANADVRQLSQRIVELEAQLQRLGRQYLESLDEQIAPTREAIAGIDATLNTLPAKEIEYARRARERLVLNEGYVFLQRQLRQVEIEDALRLDQVRVVDRPQVADADDPYFPKLLVHAVLALVLALTAGGAVAAAQAALLPRDA